MRRRAVSPVIAELLLIVITVAIGTLVYSFASTAFGGFGAGFSNVVANAGNTLAENVVVEQVYFNAGGTGGTMYALNAGQNIVTIVQIFMTNVSSGSQVSPISFTLPPPPPGGTPPPFTIQPGVSVQINFAYGGHTRTNFADVYAFTIVTSRGNQFVAYEKP